MRVQSGRTRLHARYVPYEAPFVLRCRIYRLPRFIFHRFDIEDRQDASRYDPDRGLGEIAARTHPSSNVSVSPELGTSQAAIPATVSEHGPSRERLCAIFRHVSLRKEPFWIAVHIFVVGYGAKNCRDISGLIKWREDYALGVGEDGCALWNEHSPVDVALHGTIGNA